MQHYRYTIPGAPRPVEPAGASPSQPAAAGSSEARAMADPAEGRKRSKRPGAAERDSAFFHELESHHIRLNAEQIEAVRHGDGPLLTIAGAGSGKTTTLACRAAYLIGVRGVSPRHLLLVTFSRKAADEMKLRLADMPGIAPKAAQSVEARTFHSFCLQLLRRRGIQSALLGDEGQQRMTLKRLMREAGTSIDEEPESLLALLSSYKCRLLGAEDLPEASPAEREIKRVLVRYEQWKRASGVIDFDDLLLLAYRMLGSEPDLLMALQERFRYIMVDEFQDTNTVQYELVRLLAGGRRNLMVVGDDDQTIYSFNGASAEAILTFDKVYPDAKVVTLRVNYRSSAAIVGLGNAIIRGNRNRRPKTLTVPSASEQAASKALWAGYGEASAAEAAAGGLSGANGAAGQAVEAAAEQAATVLGAAAQETAGSGIAGSMLEETIGAYGKPMFSRPATGEEEAALVASSIRKLVETGAYRYGDIAVLYRSAGSGRAAIEHLLQSGIPIEEHGEGASFYESPLLRPVMAHLRLSLHHRDKDAIEAMLPTLYVNREVAMQWIRDKDAEQAKKWPLIHLTAFPRLQQFQKDEVLERLRLIKSFVSLRPADAIRRMREAFFDKFAETNRGGTPHKELMKELLDELESSAGRFVTVESFLDFADEMARRQSEAKQEGKASSGRSANPRGRLRDHDARIASSDASGGIVDGAGGAVAVQEAAPAEEPGRVQVMTIHKSKGLEFPAVFVIGASEGIMPHRSATQPQQPKQMASREDSERDKEEALEEERRLLYVAVTRARERLYVSAPAFYHGQKAEISRFLAEAGGAKSAAAGVRSPAVGLRSR